MPTSTVELRVIWQRVEFMGVLRSACVALLGVVLWISLVPQTAQAEVYQTPAGRQASASVTLHVFVQPKIVMAAPKSLQSEIRPVENPPNNMQIYYQYKPLNTWTRGLQDSLNPLRSNKGNTLQSIAKEIQRQHGRQSKAKHEADVSEGTVELSTVFL